MLISAWTGRFAAVAAGLHPIFDPFRSPQIILNLGKEKRNNFRSGFPTTSPETTLNGS